MDSKALYSMTGYASAQDTTCADRRLGLEIRSVNSRFLDVSLRLSDELRSHEPMLRALLTARLKRGKVELRATLDHHGTDTLSEPAPALLQRIGSVQQAVRAWLPDAAPLAVADVLRICAHASAPERDSKEMLVRLATLAVNDLLAARAREGKRLAAMLHERLAGLRQLVQQAVPLVPQLVEQQRQRFLERWDEAMRSLNGVGVSDGMQEHAQNRALTEATAFALRIDVAEELTRLQAHIEEVERLLHQGGEVGKRLDFLIQEMHREANTLGSKSALLDMSRISLDMKVLIEQMREQVQNLE